MAILTVPMSACLALASLRIPLRQGNLHQATHASDAVDNVGERLKDANNIFDPETDMAEYADNFCTLAPHVHRLLHSKSLLQNPPVVVLAVIGGAVNGSWPGELRLATNATHQLTERFCNTL